MAHNAVLIHTCFAAESLPHKRLPGKAKSMGDVFVDFPNVRCGCQSRVSFRDRDQKLANGEAYVVMKPNSLGQAVPEWREIVLVKGNLPRAQMLSARNIEAAYIDHNPYQLARIGAFGEYRLTAGDSVSREDFERMAGEEVLALIGA